MRLIRCVNPGCDGRHHRDAIACPKCGITTHYGETVEATLNRTLPCKSCKTPLIVSKYIEKHYSTYLDKGTTKGSCWISYIGPCPECGDPKPLKYFSVCHGPTIAFFLTAGSVYFGLKYSFWIPTVVLGITWLFLYIRRSVRMS